MGVLVDRIRHGQASPTELPLESGIHVDYPLTELYLGDAIDGISYVTKLFVTHMKPLSKDSGSQEAGKTLLVF